MSCPDSSQTTSARLSDEARAVARKCEEIASYHSGIDLEARLRAADEVIERQRQQLLAAAVLLDRLREAIRNAPNES